MNVTGARLDRLTADVGELVAKGDRAKGRDFERYARDPVGFIRDVLKGDPWARQVAIAEAVRDHPQVTVRSCHASGKDWLAARLALWWVYARGGLVILTGPTASQVEEILMRSEVRAAFLAGGLPGELHVRALRPGGTGEAGILARTASDTHARPGLALTAPSSAYAGVRWWRGSRNGARRTRWRARTGSSGRFAGC